MLTLAMRAAFLDSKVYQEIGEEQESLLRPLAIVLAVALAFGLSIRNTPIVATGDEPAWVSALGAQNILMLMGASVILMSWALWAGIAYLLGTRLLGGKASYRQMLRALGYAYAPGVLMVLAAIPDVGGRLATVIVFWLLGTGSVAVKATQGFGWAKAFLPAMMGWFLGFWILPQSLPQLV
jgi:hypothetical protein